MIIAVVFQSLRHVWLCKPIELQHTKLPYPSPSPRACSHSCPLTQWCHSTISSAVIPFSSWLLSFTASVFSNESALFASGGQSIGASASASVLPINIQDWFPLGLTDVISLQSKGLKSLLQLSSNASIQPSLWSNSHINTWLLQKPYFWLHGPLSAK